MSITTAKYVRNPLFVDAVQVTEENFNELALWCQGEIIDFEPKPFIRVRVHTPKSPRQTRAYVGDWLLYTEMGYKIYTDKSFKSSFQPVE